LGEAALAKEKKTVDETESARRCLQNASVALDRTKRNRADEIHLSKTSEEASNFLPEPLGASAHLQLTEVVARARGLWLLNREGQP
jgi:hypothetical protein